MSAASDHLAAGRVLLRTMRPYIVQAVMALQPVEVDGLMATHGCPGPMAVDRWWRCVYDPDKIMALDLRTLATMLYHECWHLLRSHPARKAQMNAAPRAWNVCADCAINGDLSGESDLKLWGGALLPVQFGWPNHLLPEDYYRLLEQSAQSATVTVGCGSCAHGQPQPWEQGAPDGTNAPGLSEMDGQIVREQVARAVADAAQRGTLPNWLRRWADDIMHVRVDPEQLFRGLLRRACATVQGVVDYSYAAPSRRCAAVPTLILPTMRRPTLHPLIVIDTSGSMGAGDLGLALGLVHRVLQSLGHRASIPVLSCDAAVHTVERVTSAARVHLVGGGGTDMGAGLARAVTWRPRPDVVVVITDGETGWPPTAPPFPVVVALTRAAQDVPAWARSVVLRPS